MKITTFNEHGNVLEEHDYGNLAPKCFLEFNPSQPFFSIDEDELNIIQSKSRSFEKTNLKHQFNAAFDIDFSLFLESEYNKYRNIEQTLSSLMQDTIIESVDKELSVLLKNCSRYNYKPLKLSACASELLLSDKWLDVLLYHALMSSKRNRNAKDPDSALLTSFLNLLSRYYYAMKRSFEIGNLDVKIEEQLTTLRPYSYINISQNKRHPGKYCYFYNGFFDRLLFSLYDTMFQNRSVHYNLIALIKELAAKIKVGHHSIFEDLQKNNKGKRYKFYLSNFAQKDQYIVTLYDLEIDSFRIHPYDNEAFEEVSKCLKNIYVGHLKANKVKFENQVDSAYHRYCSDNGTEKWEKYLTYYQDSILPNGIGENYTKSPECYDNILLSNDSPEKDLDIRNKDIIADLFDKLKENNNKDQYPLFKGIICLNYIKHNIKKEKLGIKGNKVSQAVQNALKYIQSIYYDRLYVKSEYQYKIKTIIDEFMNLEDTRDNITDIIPNTFDGGFNLELVYNFIGLLKSRGIFKEKMSGRKLNLVFSGKESELRGYIDKWKRSTILIDDYLKAVEALVDKYVDKKK